MTTAVDTNVIVALWDANPSLSRNARSALESAYNAGDLVIAAPVFAELMAAPGRSEGFVASFLEDTSIAVDWDISEQIWKAAGRAFQKYAERRRRQRDSGARRILADFLIGAHASHRRYRFLTLDAGLYSAAFPKLTIQTF